MTFNDIKEAIDKLAVTSGGRPEMRIHKHAVLDKMKEERVIRNGDDLYISPAMYELMGTDFQAFLNAKVKIIDITGSQITEVSTPLEIKYR